MGEYERQLAEHHAAVKRGDKPLFKGAAEAAKLPRSVKREWLKTPTKLKKHAKDSGNDAAGRWLDRKKKHLKRNAYERACGGRTKKGKPCKGHWQLDDPAQAAARRCGNCLNRQARKVMYGTRKVQFDQRAEGDRLFDLGRLK